MPRNDGINRTFVRNRSLKESDVGNAQRHNERENSVYANPDIVPEQTDRNVHFKEPTGSYSEMFSNMEAAGTISTRGLKPDADHYCELIFDVNSAYFHNHGGYEFARVFYEDAYRAAVEIVGGEQYILSAVMHADERNRAMSDALGQDVYHYHMHVVYVPVVEKQILWSKRCKDPALIGTVKETIMQVSRSKKWASQLVLDEFGEPMVSKNGKTILRPSYSVLQDTFFNAMRAAGYEDVERGQRGSTEEHLTVTQFKVQQEQQRLSEMQQAQLAASSEITQLNAGKAQVEADIRKAEAKLDRIAPQIEKVQELVRKCPNDPERLLPEPGTFESARAYREKKALPLITKLLKWVHSLFRKNLELETQCHESYRTASIWKRQAQRAEDEVKLLKSKAECYDRIHRALGEEMLDKLLAYSRHTLEHTAQKQKGFER